MTFGTGGSRDPDGSIAGYAWDFDADGTTDATEPEPTHTYTASGRYFPTLTVTDNSGASSTFVEEILVGLPVAPDVHTGGAAARPSTGPWTRRTRPRAGRSSTGRRRSTAR